MNSTHSIAAPLRLRLLALGPQNVFPPVDGGKESIFGALGAVASRAHVTYAFPTMAHAKTESTGLPEYDERGVRSVPVAFQPVESVALVVAATLALRPYKFEKYGSSRAVDAFDAAIPRERFDAIICHHAHTVRLAERLCQRRSWHIPILLREHNVEYELVGSYRDSLSGTRRLAASLFAALTQREEMSIWTRVDATAFLSDQDLATAQASGACGEFVLAREGIPLPPRRNAHHPGADAPLLVLLNPRATQSVANLKMFLHEYWLPLRECNALPFKTELHVTGVDTADLGRLCDLAPAALEAAGVRGLGFLQSLEATLAGALGLISPTFMGGGIRKKVLEAMAAELPVIATDLDIGTCIYFECGRNILLLGDLTAFAGIVARLRDDAPFWASVSAAGRGTVEEFANWDAYATVVLDTLNKLVQTRSDY